CQAALGRPMRTRALALLAAVTAAAAAASAPVGLVAQGSDALYARLSWLGGFEYRGYSFDPGISVKAVSQWNLPFIAVAPVGRRSTRLNSSHEWISYAV